MYYRNISTGMAGGRYVTVQGNGGGQHVFDFAGGRPAAAAVLFGTHTTIRSNETPFGSRMLSVSARGCALYDPAQMIEAYRQGKELRLDDIPLPIRWTGKASADGTLLMLAEHISGRIRYKSPQTVKTNSAGLRRLPPPAESFFQGDI